VRLKYGDYPVYNLGREGLQYPLSFLKSHQYSSIAFTGSPISCTSPNVPRHSFRHFMNISLEAACEVLKLSEVLLLIMLNQIMKLLSKVKLVGQSPLKNLRRNRQNVLNSTVLSTFQARVAS
jgi:hypothetical protein